MSPFGYNATTAQELFPLSREEAEKNGYGWKEQEKYEHAVTMEAEGIPDAADKVSGSLSGEIIECEHKGSCNEQCSTAFKLIPSEIVFYERMRLPIPHLCPNCRHYARLAYRNPFRLWRRECQCAGAKSENGVYVNMNAHSHGAGKCSNKFETSYAPDRPEIVYCEQCYQSEVV